MKILRIFIISVLLATTGVFMPSHSFAQRSADSPQETATENSAAGASRFGRGQRDGGRADSVEAEATQSGGSVNVQVTATYDERTNSVIVRGPSEILALVAQVLADLDSTTTKVADVRIFKLRYTDATTTANIINQIFGEQQSSSQANQRGGFGPMMFRGPGGGRQTEEQDGGQATVTAAADTQTNSVVVAGPENLLNVVEDVIKALDRRDTEAADVRVFQLRYADAMNTAQMINDLFGDDAQSSGSQQGGMNFMRGGPGGMMGGGGRGGQGDQQDGRSSMLTVSAAADSRTNSVVVTGPTELLDVVADVIKNVDTQLATMADVKVYHLEYADAQDTAELINEVFGESGSSSRTTSSRNQQSTAVSFRGGGFGGMGGQQAAGTTGGIADVAIVASADSRTNSVVVSGPAETLEIITNVVKELDENPEQERQIFLFPLKNASAENLMTILNNLFAEMAALNDQATGTTGQQFQGNQRAAQPAGGGQTADSGSSGGDDLSEDTYFEADLDTNTLLVLTSSKNYDKIRPILEDLDKPIGQVLIKVLFAEVTHSDTVDLGTEFSMLNLAKGGDSVQTSQVFGTPSPLTYQGSAIGFPTGLGIRTIEGDLDLTIHALQEAGRLNVLSRPYILTSNNQLATITVGEIVPFPTGTAEVAGQSTTTIDYRDDIGIVLNVTPSINPEGLVNMTVNPQITTRSADSVAITETLNAEAFSTRSASTKVSVRNGQTIVIGGLIEDKLTDTIKKIPLLGDIPIAGHLFKRTIKEKTKTELLIFLTPHVAMDAIGLTPISDLERARSILNTDKTASEIFKKHMDAMQPGPADVNEPE